MEQATTDKDILDGLLKTVVDSGYLVTAGDVQAAAAPRIPGELVLKVPLTIRLSESIPEVVARAANVLGGTVRTDAEVDKRGFNA